MALSELHASSVFISAVHPETPPSYLSRVSEMLFLFLLMCLLIMFQVSSGIAADFKKISENIHSVFREHSLRMKLHSVNIAVFYFQSHRNT